MYKSIYTQFILNDNKIILAGANYSGKICRSVYRLIILLAVLLKCLSSARSIIGMMSLLTTSKFWLIVWLMTSPSVLSPLKRFSSRKLDPLPTRTRIVNFLTKTCVSPRTIRGSVFITTSATHRATIEKIVMGSRYPKCNQRNKSSRSTAVTH